MFCHKGPGKTVRFAEVAEVGAEVVQYLFFQPPHSFYRLFLLLSFSKEFKE
jgi:hypothetical protein